MRKILPWALVSLCFVADHAMAAGGNAPHQINFSGYLTNGGGSAQNGTFDMKFGIYINGTRVWCADYNSVSVSQGQFNVILGANGPQGGVSYDAATCNTPSGGLPLTSALVSSVTSATPVMLEMEVWNGSGYDVLSPQFPISSAIFALQAESVGGYTSSQLAKQDGSGNIISSTSNTPAIDPNGNVIGPTLTMPATAVPATQVGKGIIYFDNGSDTFQASENGGAFVPLLTQGGPGTLSGLTAGDVAIASGGSNVSTNGNLKFDNVNNVLTVDASTAPTGDGFIVSTGPVASASKSLIRYGTSDIAGGNAQGTFEGINATAGYTGDFVNYQVNGVTKFEVSSAGVITGNGSGLTNVAGTMSGMTAGQVPYATSATAVATSPDFTFDNVNHKTTFNSTNPPVGDALQIANAPAASNASSLLTLGATNLAGASANGTYIGANPAAAGADFMNYEVGGTSDFKVDKNGNVTATSFTGNGAGLTGVSANPAGANTQLQFNNSGAMGASANMTWDNTNFKVTLDASNAPAGDALQISNAPKSSASNALLTLGATDLAGASASGTYMGANPAAAGADWENYEVGGVSKYLVDKNGNVTATSFTGNGSGLTGVTASSFSGVLPLANGGTNANLVPANGGLVWSNATQMQITAAGTANQALVSGGAGAPVWSSDLTVDNTNHAVSVLGAAPNGDGLIIGEAPKGSATKSLVRLDATDLVGASANGTYIGANPAAANADFINYQVGGITKFSVDKNGVITGNGSGLTGVSGAQRSDHRSVQFTTAERDDGSSTADSPGTTSTIKSHWTRSNAPDG